MRKDIETKIKDYFADKVSSTTVEGLCQTRHQPDELGGRNLGAVVKGPKTRIQRHRFYGGEEIQRPSAAGY